MLRALFVVCTGPPASLACTVKLNKPTPVGVPEITPLLAFSVRPDGNTPLASDHETGGVPPLALTEVVYGTFRTALGKTAVWIARGPACTVTSVLPLTEFNVA